MVPNFRAWDETQHKMLQVDCIEFIDGKAYWVEASPADAIVQGENDGPIGDDSHLKLEQFTGLKDANGKEIYECDIVHIITEDNYERTGKVVFEKGCYMVDNGMDKYPINQIGFELDTLEVVGNAHTNPELIDFYNMKQLGDLTTEAQHDTRTD